jgi:NADH:ubiquinone oxidoreductase subunit F (NADH-binding)
LMRFDPAREGIGAYRAADGGECGVTGRALIDVIEAIGLRGRGGAAFPTGEKLRSVADRPAPRYVVANGEEGEPSSIKDRWLMRQRPHLVLDGLLRAAEAIKAAAGYVYLSDAEAAISMHTALAERGELPLSVTVVTVAPSYVAGEETAVVRAIGGGPAKPSDKPPRPFESGIAGCPTLVCNVETLAQLPMIATNGGEHFRSGGDGRNVSDTFLMSASGACARPGLYEVPFGVKLGETLHMVADASEEACGYLMGGFFGGIIGPRGVDMRVGYDELRAEGTGLGCGAIITLGKDDCPIAAAADVMTYFSRYNARQCGSCIRGTSAMSDVLIGLAEGRTDEDQVAKLQKWSISLLGRGACATLDGATNLAASLLREFPTEVTAHVDKPCPCCAARPHPDCSRFTIPPNFPIGDACGGLS